MRPSLAGSGGGLLKGWNQPGFAVLILSDIAMEFAGRSFKF